VQAHAREREQDRRLLGRVAAGDVRALRRLFDEHGARVLAVARRVLHDAHDAQDVVQETFVEVWRRSREFDPSRGNVGSWVVTIARSRAIDRMRAHASAGRALDAAADHLQPKHPLALDEIEDLRRDFLHIHEALAALSPKHHTVIHLAYFEGLSQSEIAHRTHAPLGTVKLRLRSALSNLERLLRRTRPRVGCARPRSAAGVGVTRRRRADSGRYR